MQIPYAARPGQQDLADSIEDVQARGRHAVLEAPTGTGKTIAALVASLSVTAKDGRRIVYLTRTNSQQSQVVREHKVLVDAGEDAGLLVPFMGRRQYCPLLRDDERFRDGSPEEMGRLCRDAKRKAVQQHETGAVTKGACPYYLRLLEDGTGPVEALLREGGMDAARLGAAVSGCGSCPYEALKALLPQADTVVVPYVFVVDARLRQTLLAWLGTGLDDVHMVVDEAHHLPEAAREHHSPRLSANALHRAAKEAEEYKDPVLAGRVLSTSLMRALEGTLWDLVADHVIDDDGRLPAGALQEALMERLRVPSPVIARAATDLEAWGETIREDRRSKGRLPRSYLGAVGAFLLAWLHEAEAPYVHIVTGGENPGVEMVLLDPRSVLGWLHECASTVHMSGTIAPTQDHIDVCGLPADTRQEVFPSPFDPDHLRVVGLRGVHRRYQEHQQDPRHAERQQEAVRDALTRLPGKTGLFFPSHAMLADYMEVGLLHGLDRPTYREDPGMDTSALTALVDRFKRDPRPDALLLGVLGGRLTEGIDYPGETLEALVVLGVPYPKPTARLQALVDHGDRVQDGKGWTHAVHNPTGRILRQAVGRLVRGPADRGTAVIVDERVARFGGHLPRLEMVDDLVALESPRPEEGTFRSARQVAAS